MAAQGSETVLTGVLDRAALYGVLAEIESLGLDLLEVRRLTPRRDRQNAANSEIDSPAQQPAPRSNPRPWQAGRL